MTNRNSNNINIPEAREAMDKFKMEAASEVGVNLKNGYNGDLTSREAGSVGGQMVKNVCPIRTARFTRKNRIMEGHMQAVLAPGAHSQFGSGKNTQFEPEQRANPFENVFSKTAVFPPPAIAETDL